MEIGNTVPVNDFSAKFLVENRPVAISIRVDLESWKTVKEPSSSKAFSVSIILGNRA